MCKKPNFSNWRARVRASCLWEKLQGKKYHHLRLRQLQCRGRRYMRHRWCPWANCVFLCLRVSYRIETLRLIAISDLLKATGLWHWAILLLWLSAWPGRRVWGRGGVTEDVSNNSMMNFSFLPLVYELQSKQRLAALLKSSQGRGITLYAIHVFASEIFSSHIYFDLQRSILQHIQCGGGSYGKWLPLW